MKKNIIGFWGYPEPDLIKKYKTLYPQAKWVDLDIDFEYPQSAILPDSYCKIIKNIIDNCVHLKEEMIVVLAPIGKDKCDSGWFASALLKDMGFVVETSIYEELDIKNKQIICESNIPLRKKFEIITDAIINPYDLSKIKTCKAKFGFWGVPPNDLSLLELFPDETHIFGWTRCVEAGCPANLELEMQIDSNIPTVFYAQSFCSKTQIAKYLADKYNGLFIDVDDYATKSTRAKIEAFIKLR